MEFEKILHSSDVVNRIQDNVKQSVNPIAKVRLINGTMLEKVSIISGSANEIAHKLGEKAKGYIITNVDGASVIWRSGDYNNTKFIYLNSSVNVIVDIWVFK